MEALVAYQLADAVIERFCRILYNLPYHHPSRIPLLHSTFEIFIIVPVGLVSVTLVTVNWEEPDKVN